jgi:ribonuclease E
MLETERSETERNSDNDGGVAPSGVTGTSEQAGSEPAASTRRARRPRRAATRAAGPPSADVQPPPAQGGATVPDGAASGAGVAAPPAVAATVPTVPSATPAVPGTAPTAGGGVPPATFQPPPVIFQPPAAGQPAADRGRGEAPGGDDGPDETPRDGSGDGASRKRRRRGGRSKGQDGDGEAGGDNAAEPASGDSARSGTREADRGSRGTDADGGRPADKKSSDKKSPDKKDSGKKSSDKQADGNQADDKQRGADVTDSDDADDDGTDEGGSRRRRRRRRRGSAAEGDQPASDDPPNTVVHVRVPRPHTGDEPVSSSDVKAVRGSTRLEAKRQRRREGRESGRRRPPIISESEFLARRESVDRMMVVRQQQDRTQIAVLEDGVLVEHYVDKASHQSLVGNVYLGKVQNVLPSMEAAFVDVGKGRNAVLYAGEVNFDASGLEGESKRIESALKSGQSVLVQVTKDPVGHKGARLTSQVSLPGRYLVYVPGRSMMGISRKLPDKERTRLKQILKQVMPEGAGVIVRTAAEGATEEELSRDVARLAAQWAAIEQKAKTASAPELLYSEPDLTIRVVRDIFNEDFASLVVAGDDGWDMVDEYVRYVAPHLADRLTHYTDDEDVFAKYRIDEQLAKALERKVWLPSGGSLVIDNTEAMTVVDVNTGKFTGQGGNLEETVTRNNLEAAEEIVRQLRLRDVGGIIVIDFIDMVLESNRELVLRRMLECLARDRTKHQVAEVTSLGLVQMTRKRVGAGLLEAFSEPCDCCNGRGRIITLDLAEVGNSGHSRLGGADGRQTAGGRQDKNGNRDRNGQSDKGGQDRAGQHKNGHAEPDEGDRQPGERQPGGRRRRRSSGSAGSEASQSGTAVVAGDAGATPASPEAPAAEVPAAAEAPAPADVPADVAPTAEGPAPADVPAPAEVADAAEAPADVPAAPEAPAVAGAPAAGADTNSFPAATPAPQASALQATPDPAAAAAPAAGMPAPEITPVPEGTSYPGATPAPEVSAVQADAAPEAAPARVHTPMPAADPAAEGAPATESGPAHGGAADPDQTRWPDDAARPGTDPAAW